MEVKKGLIQVQDQSPTCTVGEVMGVPKPSESQESFSL